MERIFIREYILMILSILLAICIRCQTLVQTSIVETASGPVQGYHDRTAFNNIPYSIFKGIKFAKPPVGEYRFVPPRPIDPWSEVFNATEEGPVCPQYDTLLEINTYMGDEDCLSLNVYTPMLDFNSTTKYPVMVWIYGGGFAQGYKNQSVYGPDFLIEGGCIMVAPNYRIGNLGFMNLGLAGAHGNAGMMDQVLALKWVQKNIAKFGGDPNNVTIFGESAGSSSVVLHELSPQSKGLFHKSIAQSGAPLILLSQSPLTALVSAFKLANDLGFHTLNRTALLEFYRKVDVRELVMKESYMYLFTDVITRPFQPSIEAPVVSEDQIFLGECPITLMMKGQIRKGPKMLGFNKNELYAFATRTFIPQLLDLFLPHNVMLLIIRELTQFLTNIIMAPDTEITQRFFAAHNDDHPVYFNLLTYTGFPRHILTSLPVYNPAHADDLGLLFHTPKYGFANTTDPNDPMNVFRQKLATYYTNFAKFSNPTPIGNNLLEAVWEPSGSSGRQFQIDNVSKNINRSLGAFGAIVESIYYFILPLCSSCYEISYATPYTDLFSLTEFTLFPQFGESFGSTNITSLLNPETITTPLHNLDLTSLI